MLCEVLPTSETATHTKAQVRSTSQYLSQTSNIACANTQSSVDWGQGRPCANEAWRQNFFPTRSNDHYHNRRECITCRVHSCIHASETCCVTCAVQMQLRNSDNVVATTGSENVTQVMYACGIRSSKALKDACNGAHHTAMA